MIHTTVGTIGHLSVLVSFVSALAATFGYLQASIVKNITDNETWRRFARASFYVHAAAVFMVVGSLFYMIANHYFEYHYVWKNSDLSLPTQYIFAAFWHDQEGSFLLWIFWHVVLGLILIRINKGGLEAPMMFVFALVQAFLTSMILGVIIPWLDLKIGSTPFLLLREASADAPIFQQNPNFIPADGNGMNPLLQNYWMVIHPPTLFLGFAATLVPFAYCMAGLWQKQVVEWVRPALPWALFCALVLGVGILMGGYWAYETLNFGGYWNWDPVENGSLVPWLILVASTHCMIVAKKSSTGLKASIILTIAMFLSILYATFLTRSGILGDGSVHSFTDLGLSGQLLIYLFTFIIVSVLLAVRSWKYIKSDDQELTTYSREFWLFMGATVLCLSAFQIIVPTSIPVFNKVAELFGQKLNLAPPVDAIAFYNKFQLWFAVSVAILTGVGQYFWWKKVQKNKMQELLNPLWVTLLVTAGIITFAQVNNWKYIVLLTASVFAIVANGAILLNIIRGNYRLSGGAITHLGVGLMLVGILFSSGYSKIVSMNMTGMPILPGVQAFASNEGKESKENLQLWINQPQRMGDYLLTYRGKRMEARDMPGKFFPKSWIEVVEKDFHAVAMRDIVLDNKTYHKKGDTLEVYPENTYYEVEYRDPDGKVFSLYPRIQQNERMGNAHSPDIKRTPSRDLYTYVAYTEDNENVWSKTQTDRIALKDTFFVNDYVAVLESVGRTNAIEGVALAQNDIAVKAQIRIFDKEKDYLIEPSFAINAERMVMRKPEISEDLGLKIQFMEIDPKTGSFVFNSNTTYRDFIVMKAMEKPLINVLWIGTLVLALGLAIASARRFKEFFKMRDKELQA